MDANKNLIFIFFFFLNRNFAAGFEVVRSTARCRWLFVLSGAIFGLKIFRSSCLITLFVYCRPPGEETGLRHFETLPTDWVDIYTHTHAHTQLDVTVLVSYAMARKTLMDDFGCQSRNKFLFFFFFFFSSNHYSFHSFVCLFFC